MRKLIFVNRYFYPDHSATSHMLSDLAFGLTKELENTEIHIVTSRQRYDGAGSRLKKAEKINNVNIHRVWTSNFGRKNLLGRSIDYMFFYLTALLTLIKITKAHDVVVAKTDPPLISLLVAVVAKLKNAELINWIQDLFPEVAAELGVKFVRGIPFKILIKLRNATLNQATTNIVIGSLMGERLEKEGVSKEKITIIHNWIDEDTISPISHDQNPLRKLWGLEDKFVIGYSGNFGRGHDFLSILEAAKALKDNPAIQFLFIGGGAQLPNIKRQCKEKELNNIIFRPYQPREELNYSLSVPDVHLISLKPELEGLIVPSKFYGILAVGRPVIYIGASDGEIPTIIRKQACGRTVAIGDVEQLVLAIVEQSKLTQQLDKIKKIRDLFEERFSKARAVNQFKEALSDFS